MLYNYTIEYLQSLIYDLMTTRTKEERKEDLKTLVRLVNKLHTLQIDEILRG